MTKIQRKKIPAMSSRKLIKLLRNAGAVFDREGKGDHVIYRRDTNGKVMKAPVIQGKTELPPQYSLMVFKQLGLSDEEINKVLK